MALPALMALMALMALLAACGKPAAGPANVLLITLDTVRADHLGAYGDANAETPNLDALARDGVRFANASSPVPLTLPAHSSLLSGLLPPHHGLRNNGAGVFPAALPTLASRLAAAGYHTAAFVGSFVLDHRFGLARGFATYDDEMERDASGGRALDAERRGDRVVDHALAWLARTLDAPGSQPAPFFLWVHLYDAHAPYEPPSPYGERHPGRPYDGEIAFADAQVGRLLAELERRHLTAGTVVAVAGDHGEALGEHGELTHGLLLYEPTLHVPLLLRAAGLAAGRVVRTPVSLVDLGPTLAGLAGQPLAAPLDGRDLAAVLRRGEEPPAGDLYAETRYPTLFGWSPLTALRKRDRKYIAAPRPELYDLAADPREATNLAANRPAGSEAAESRGFAGRLTALAAPLPGAAAPAAPGELTAEMRAQLESLGYAAAPRGRGSSGAGSSNKDVAGAADPKDRVALFRRYEAANTALRAGQTAAALTALAALTAEDPGNPVFRGKLAQGFRERGAPGDLAKAIALYRQAAERAPEDSEAWYNLGVALRESGQAKAAGETLAVAVRLDPRYSEAMNALGIALLEQGRPAEARRQFEATLALDPGDARAYNNLGNLERAGGHLDAAERDYRQATTLAPRYAEAWNGLGTLAVERNRPQDALACFARALELAPRYHEVRMNRAIAFEMAGDPQAAVAAYREFLAATAGNPEYAAQRRAAQQLLARLSTREAGSATPEGR